MNGSVDAVTSAGEPGRSTETRPTGQKVRAPLPDGADPLRGARSGPTVADAIAGVLVAAGLDMAFAYPGGGSNLAVVDALGRAGADVVLTRAECGAAFMAAAVSELNGTPGLVLVGLGPGAANVVNGAAYAYLDRVPIVFLADAYGPDEAATTTHQLIDQRAIFAPIVKQSVLLDPARVAAQVEEAVRLALAHPRGPVLLELSRGVADAPVAGPPAAKVTAATRAPVAAGRADLAAELRASAAVLAAARRPLILVGLEAVRAVAQSDLVALAEKLRAPVLATFKAKGVFPERHPYFAGLVTHAAIEAQLLEPADAILGVGLDPVELLPKPWPYAGAFVSLRACDVMDSYFAAAASHVGDVGLLVRTLSAAVDEAGTCSEWTPAAVEEVRRALLERLRVPSPDESPASWEIVEAALAGASADVIVTVDAGAHMFPASWFCPSPAPGRFLMSNGLSTMGYAVPAAVGAALARPGSQVLAFTGDGGALLHGAELETAVRVGVSLVVVVLNDSSLSLIRVKQADRGLDRAAVDFGAVDFARLAESLGARGMRAETPAAVRAAVRDAFAAGGVVLVEAPLSGADYQEITRRIRG